MVRKLGLDYVVITSVTRDDLRDGGAGQFSATIESIRNVDQKIKVEALIPDLRGDTGSLETLVKASPYVLAHNIETVKRLYPEVRPQADYNRSLNILSKVKLMNCGIITKSSLMLGMGESRGEVEAAMKDLRRHGCDCLTLGQYLAPSKMHYPVKEYISPGVFDELGKVAMQSGFRFVSSGPKVRSSYQAMDMIKEVEECMT
jgi:lipoic acid synthetase